MQHPTSVLLPECDRLLPTMRVTRTSDVAFVADKLLKNVHDGRYGEVSIETGIPQIWIATSFQRESSSDFTRSPAQGDRWDRVSVNVPRGRGPFKSWKEAARDAYHLNGLDRVGAANWTWALGCYYWELFNGFGYRDFHHMRSPYLFGGTNLQQLGKYTSDGKFDAGHMDTQLGVVPVAMRMAQLEPKLAFPGAWPFALGPTSVPSIVPTQTPVAAYDLFAVQRALKAAGFDPGLVDGSFGRKTSAALRAFEASRGFVADGLLDSQTVDALLVKKPENT